jgi:hypothetical protein
MSLVAKKNSIAKCNRHALFSNAAPTTRSRLDIARSSHNAARAARRRAARRE